MFQALANQYVYSWFLIYSPQGKDDEMNRTLLRGGARTLVTETDTQIENGSSPRWLQICKDAQKAVGPSRKEDHGRLQGGGDLEEWVKPRCKIGPGRNKLLREGGG